MFRSPWRVALVAVLLALAGAFVSAPGASAQPAPGEGPGGPILVVTDASTTFGRYYAEILRTEGLNEFAVADTSALNPQTLGAYQVVVLAATDLNDGHAAALSGWVEAGGNLIAMKPDARLAGLLGLGADMGDLSERGYLKVDTASAPGAGITGDTMQFHGTADRWSLAGATPVATLFSDATTPTFSPAVTLRSVGAAGGQAAAFTYDLARSIVYTRQGNPAWAGDKRDGQSGPSRSDDLFFGARSDDPQPDWVNLSKVHIPQADEQQRLLANLITQMNLDRAPLPRFWYFPHGKKAAVVLTGDDHAKNGTAGQFEIYKAASPAGCSVADWECIRSTSYIYVGTSIPNAAAYAAEGFEIALHLDTGCTNFTPVSIKAAWDAQLPQFSAAYPVPASRTNRTHCAVWSDWVGEPIAELAHGVRLDTNYYYWPGIWMFDSPGMFTGSGMPMRFADSGGSLIDVYQAATQITDEWGASDVFDAGVARHVTALLDRALGPDGYYGAVTANMHTDIPDHPGATAIVAAAKARDVPVVSAAQMLDWVDGRNGSSFQGVSFSGNQLHFSVAPGNGSRGLNAMLPASAVGGALSALSRDGTTVTVTPRRVKGIDYVLFDALAGSYLASYGQPAPTTALLSGKRSAPDRSAPRVKVLKRTIRASRKGVVRLRVKCPRGEVRCRLDIRLRYRGRDVARKRLTVKGAKTVSVKLRLKRSARARLLKQRSLRVKAVIKATDAAGNHATTTTKLKLLAPH